MRRAIIAMAVLCAAPRAADAFCGFYVEGSGKELHNEATQVVLMREGTRTVLSMQNHYEGPPEAFALVVPVPVVLQEKDVKTLPREVFAKLEVMDAPRLVEYWERDPCEPDLERSIRRRSEGAKVPSAAAVPDSEDLGVTIEAQFTVGEYDIVILSAKDSTGLDTWLQREKYAIPAGAEPLLRPYVEGGWKFFVAKVDPKKVQFQGDQAMLSPLRFHYDAEDFVLPVRLGLINSAGMQDLIVHILSPGKRFEVANYPNAFIPTNLDLEPAAKKQFAAFYAALFDRTVEKNPRAVITEYAWDASTCDPCPGPQLDGNDLATLGADVVGQRRFVLTRLHARYGKDLQEDLVFREAAPVAGGREARDATGRVETGAQPARINNFQARYAIRHAWTGPIECANPVRGRWGGPPPGETYRGAEAGKDLAFAPRGTIQLAQMVVGDVPEVELTASGAEPAPGTTPDTPDTPDTRKPHDKAGARAEDDRRGCGCQSQTTGGGASGAALLLLALITILRRTR